MMQIAKKIIADTIPPASKVLVAPLNWGLGHATRCIPLIRFLLHHSCEVSLASDGAALSLLQKEFPGLPTFTLPGYQIKYPHHSMALNMLWQSPKIYSTIRAEQKLIDKVGRSEQWDFLLSDNRYGVRHPDCHNIILCHQINIQENNPFIKWGGNLVHQSLLKNFDVVWIPDFAKPEAIAGKLSNCSWPQVKYLGPLSRYQKQEYATKRKYLVVLSGPEPKRTQLEKSLTKALKGNDYWMVRGVMSEKSCADSHKVNYLTSQQLEKEIQSSETIICRAGYSSIMDLIALDKKAILIPTPGQSEQVYLADYLGKQNKYPFTILKEDELLEFMF